jgi:hypothetical protein
VGRYEMGEWPKELFPVPIILYGKVGEVGKMGEGGGGGVH